MKKKQMSWLIFTIIPALFILTLDSCKKKSNETGTTVTESPVITFYRCPGEAQKLSLFANYEFSDRNLRCLGNFNESKLADKMLGIIDQDKTTGDKVICLSSDNGKATYIYSVSNNKKGNILFSLIQGTNDTTLLVYDFNWAADTGNLILSYKVTWKSKMRSTILHTEPVMHRDSRSSLNNLGSRNSMNFSEDPPQDELDKSIMEKIEFFATFRLNFIVDNVIIISKKLDSIANEKAKKAKELWEKAFNSANHMKEYFNKGGGETVVSTEESQVVNEEILPDTQDDQGNSLVQSTLEIRSLKLITGDEQQGSANQLFPQSVIVVVTDDKMLPIENVAVTFSTDHGGLPGYIKLYSDANGFISVPWTAGDYIGDQTMKARITNAYGFFNCQPAEIFITNKVGPGPDEFIDYSVSGEGATHVHLEESTENSLDVVHATGNVLEIRAFGGSTIAFIFCFNFNGPEITQWNQIQSGTYSVGPYWTPGELNCTFEVNYSQGAKDYSYYSPVPDNPSLTGTCTITRSGDYISGTFSCAAQDWWNDYPTDPKVSINGTFKVKKDDNWQ